MGKIRQWEREGDGREKKEEDDEVQREGRAREGKINEELEIHRGKRRKEKVIEGKNKRYREGKGRYVGKEKVDMKERKGKRKERRRG